MRCLLLDLTSLGKLTRPIKIHFAVTITAYNLCVIGQEFTSDVSRLFTPIGGKLPRNQFQDLSRFRPPADRGPAWFVQLWWLFDALFVRPTPQALYPWRRFIWRLFGAKIGHRVLIRPGVRVTFPWKVAIGDHCWIGDNATLYSVANIAIGEHSVISQEAYLCAGTHDHCDISFPLLAAPITDRTRVLDCGAGICRTRG